MTEETDSIHKTNNSLQTETRITTLSISAKLKAKLPVKTSKTEISDNLFPCQRFV